MVSTDVNPSPGIVGSARDQINQDSTFDADKWYEVRVTRPIEYPVGSGHWLLPAKYVELRGDALNMLLDIGDNRSAMLEAREAVGNDQPWPFEERPSRTNLTSVKGFKK
jgi:hypothetical protein